MIARLDKGALARLPSSVARPAYEPAGHGAGIVHIGVGAFHRAHQAAYTDAALAAGGGDWRIDGISLRSTDIAAALNGQDGLYTLIEHGEEGARARVIGSIRRVIAASREPGAALEAIIAPHARIVSLTVTEKAYGIERAKGAVDTAHPSVSADLAEPAAPRGVLGLLVEGLRLRRQRGLAPFTVLCCDNLPDNGRLVRTGVLDFAQRRDAALADWISENVAFPCTMVDRITPAPTDETLGEAERLIGLRDLASVETEPFTQWVIEDRFTAGRPAWENAGAIFVEDVAPYEAMKLRMLNGTHSMLAYAGFLSGHATVRDVMADAALARLVRRHLGAAAATLAPLEGFDTGDYAEALARRFANPAIAHETYQIAMDGTEKLPQRILAPAMHAAEHGQDLRPFAFAVAAWMRYCLGRTDSGKRYALRDPREQAIAAALEGAGDDAACIFGALSRMPDIFPKGLTADTRWSGLTQAFLDGMLKKGVAGVVQQEAARA